jgi:hypothetical protein
MLITKEVTIIINSSNIKYYRELGYVIKVKDKISIPIENLTHGSHVEIDVKCDICNCERKITYNRYINNIKKYNIFSCSRKCANIKRKKTNFEKFGVENVSQSKDVKKKKIVTCLKNFGVEYSLQSDTVKEKIKKTCLEKYGVENSNKSDIVKEKIKKTCLEKYGVSSPMKNDEIYSKLKKTNLEKYGNDCYMLTDDFKEKSKQTNLDKHGVEKYYNFEKITNTFLERYGKWYTKTDECKNKTLKTNMERYGEINPNCNKDIKNKANKTRKINRLKELKKYNIVNIDYEKGIYTFKCDSGCEHEFDIEYDTFKNRKLYGIKLCTICNNYLKNSGDEINTYNFIKENYSNKIILNNRKIINPYELDIYLPDLKLAFEYNGLFWHNEITKDKNYHLNKTEMCEEKEIQLIQIYEDDWKYKQDIIKSMILNKLNKIENKIYARKCEIKEINDNKSIRNFLNKNHIQGFIGSKVKIGLFFNNELMSLMTFGNRRVAMGKKSTKEGEYELLRFCNKLNINVIGGASKLFKYFIKTYKPKEITTYADRSFSQGNLYKQLGFNFIGKTEPNYYYIIGDIRNHRFNFRKDKLVKEGFDFSKTEHEIMLERKIYRIFDSGNLKFRYTQEYLIN